MSALDIIIAHYRDALLNWHDPLHPEAVAKKEVLELAQKELQLLRTNDAPNHENAPTYIYVFHQRE